MPGGARSFHFSTGGGGNGFNFSNADDIFGEFMRSSGGGDDFDFGGFGMGGMPGGMGGMGGGGEVEKAVNSEADDEHQNPKSQLWRSRSP